MRTNKIGVLLLLVFPALTIASTLGFHVPGISVPSPGLGHITTQSCTTQGDVILCVSEITTSTKSCSLGEVAVLDVRMLYAMVLLSVVGICLIIRTGVKGAYLSISRKVMPHLV